MLATASAVPWAHSQQVLEGPVQLPASRVSRVSLLPPHHRHVTSARLGKLTTTPIRLRSAWTVQQAHTLDVARQSVLFVLLARLTAMRVRPRHARHAWRVSTGRLRLLISRASVCSVLLAKWMGTPTVLRSASTVSSASTVARAPSLPCCAQTKDSSMMTAIPPRHAATRISASKYVWLAPKIMTATTAPTAQPAMPADTRLAA